MSITRINEFHASSGRAQALFEFLISIKNFISTSAGCEYCEVLQKNDDESTFVVIERWDSKDSHKKSLESYPQEKMADAMPLLGAPPKGGFYHN